MIAPRFRAFALLLLAVLLVGDRAATSKPPRGASLHAATKKTLRFEPNVGQFPADVRLRASAGEATLTLRDDGATVGFHTSRSPVVDATMKQAGGAPIALPNDATLTMKVAGARPTTPVVADPLVTRVHHLRGSEPSAWHANVPTYGRATYPSVVDGVDLVFHGEEGELEYDLIVAPGTDPAGVALEIGGADDVGIAPDGQVLIHANGRTIVQRRPRVYQEEAGVTREVPSSYRLVGPAKVGFEIAAYDRSRPLVIDPVFAYATYLGGNGTEILSRVQSDSAGNTYFAASGESSTPPPFPANKTNTSPTPSQLDVMLAKLSPAGELLWLTYYGGSAAESANDLVIDHLGRPVIVGTTTSTDIFLTPNAYLKTSPDGASPQDSFLLVLAQDGATPVYSTRIDLACKAEGSCAGARIDTAYGVAVRNGIAYVNGFTQGTPIAIDGEPLPVGAFVIALDMVGGNPIFRTVLGGTTVVAAGIGIAGSTIGVDAGGRIHVAGVAGKAFATTPSAFQPALTPGPVPPPATPDSDVFYARLTSMGAVDYATFIGGTDQETPTGLVVDAQSRALIVGVTASTAAPAASGCNGNTIVTPFPTKNALYPTTVAGGGAFIAKIDPNQSGAASLVFSTFLGGETVSPTALFPLALNMATSVALDPSGAIVVGGVTSTNDFPTVPAASFETMGIDAFVTRLSPNATSIEASYVFGGESIDFLQSVATDGGGGIVMGGITLSTSNLPLTNAIQKSFAGGTDLFLARIGGSVVPPFELSPSQSVVPSGTKIAFIATGGSGAGYTFALATNTSGATIDATTGEYVAGPKSGHDVVVATDVGGGAVAATVDVKGAPEAAPLVVHPSFTLTPPRGQVQLEAEGGTPPYTFTIARNLSGASVNANGRYQAGSHGDVSDDIIVTDASGRAAFARVSVTAGVRVTPALAEITQGSVLTLTATGGNRSYRWSASDGTIDAQGVFTAPLKKGAVTITVTDGLGNTATASISVEGALAIAPPTAETVPGGAVQFTAAGGTQKGYVYTLLTSPPAGGTLDPTTGLFTAGPNGNVIETVQLSDSAGKRAIATVNVGAAPVVTPPALPPAPPPPPPPAPPAATTPSTPAPPAPAPSTTKPVTPAAPTSSDPPASSGCSAAGGATSNLPLLACLALGAAIALRRSRRTTSR